MSTPLNARSQAKITDYLLSTNLVSVPKEFLLLSVWASNFRSLQKQHFSYRPTSDPRTDHQSVRFFDRDVSGQDCYIAMSS